MSLAINLLSKVLILVLFYFSWQNLEQVGLKLNQNLVYFYLIMVVLSLIVDKFFFKGQASENKKEDKVLSTLLSVSWFSALIIPILEYSYFIRSNSVISTFGIIVVFIGIIIRGLSIKYLGKYFSRDVETWHNHTLVRSGLYKYIRHPAYLGNILQIIGFPLILNSYYSLVLSVITVYLFLKRIEVEERFLEKELEKYKEYQSETKKLIPYLW